MQPFTNTCVSYFVSKGQFEWGSVMEMICLEGASSVEEKDIKPWDRREDPPNDLRRSIRESEGCLQLPQADRLNHHFLRCPAGRYSSASNCFQSTASASPSHRELLQPLAFFTLYFSFFPLQSSSILTSAKWLSASLVWWWSFIELSSNYESVVHTIFGTSKEIIVGPEGFKDSSL